MIVRLENLKVSRSRSANCGFDQSQLKQSHKTKTQPTMSQNTKELKLAVLIDADNVPYNDVKGMM